MNRPVTRGLKRKKRAPANVPASLDQPSTSSTSCEDQNSLLPSTCSPPDEISPIQEETDCLVPVNKRSRVDDVNEESPQGSTTSESAATVNPPTTPDSQENKRGKNDNNNEQQSSVRNGTDNEPITIESPGPTTSHSLDDVMIVGDVQVGRPEVIDLERLPTIRQGGSVVVDLTNDASFHDSNVVDLTRETPSDSSVDSSPVIVCVNRIYRGDPVSQRPSCRFASLPSMLERSFPVSSPDDEILEVTDADIRRKQMSSLDTSSSEGAEPDTAAKRNITCPICMDDESTIKRRKRQLTSTTCGHVFCDKCIRSAVQMQNKCPTCRKKLSLKQLHPIFL